MKNQHGQSLIELAIVLPLVVWLIAGAFFFLRLQHTRLLLTIAMHSAGREAAQVFFWRASGQWVDSAREAVAAMGLETEKLEVRTRWLGLIRCFLSYPVPTPAVLQPLLPKEIIVTVKGAEIP